MRNTKPSKKIRKLAERLDVVMETYNPYDYKDEVHEDGVKQAYHAIVYSPLEVIDELLDIAERRMCEE